MLPLLSQSKNGQLVQNIDIIKLYNYHRTRHSHYRFGVIHETVHSLIIPFFIHFINSKIIH